MKILHKLVCITLGKQPLSGVELFFKDACTTLNASITLVSHKADTNMATLIVSFVACAWRKIRKGTSI